MKKLIGIVMLLLPCIGMAQNSGRNIDLTVQNSKGEAAHNDIIVFIKAQNPVVHTLHHGAITVSDVTDADTLAVITGNRMYEFPADGMNTLALMLNKQNRVAEVMCNGTEMSSSEYKMTRIPQSSPSVNVNNIAPNTYTSLADYLTGRIAGLVINGDQAYLDGMVPLFVVDGMRMQSFAAANMLVNPNEIESVTVDRNGVIYGAAGMNGVISITLQQ